LNSDGYSKVNFDIYPEEEGEHLYRLYIKPLNNEATIENNSKTFNVKVVRDKIRVLHIVGTPTWDVRFLRRFLKKELNIELVSFFILRTNADLLYDVPENELSLIPFPSREIFIESLHTFDVIILQNFDYMPYVPVQYLENIRRVVKEKGVGLLMIGGDRGFAKGGYKNSPIEDILPVEITPNIQNQPEYLEMEYYPQFEPVAKEHPLFQGIAEYLDSLSPLFSLNTDVKLKDGSVMLIRYPGLLSNRSVPIISLSNAGKGRTAVIATDSLWVWAFPSVMKVGTNITYYKFFQNMLYWLVNEEPFRNLRLKAERSINDSKRFHIEVVARDNSWKPLENTSVILELNSVDDTKLMETTATTDKYGKALFDINIPDANFYTLKAMTRDASNYVFEAKTILNAGNATSEFKDVKGDSIFLKNLSRITGGRFFTIDEFNPEKIVFQEKTSFRTQGEELKSLWDSIPYLIVFFTLLIIEWVIRRGSGLM